MSSSYEDIIHLPHHVSPTRPRMSIHDRAAQFSPFAALTGHSDAVDETARLTESEILLDDTVISEINEQLQYLQKQLTEGTADSMSVNITYYIPDERKAGGQYVTVRSAIKKIDNYTQTIHMKDGTAIPMGNIKSIKM